jgi:hypothetical protein
LDGVCLRTSPNRNTAWGISSSRTDPSPEIAFRSQRASPK